MRIAMVSEHANPLAALGGADAGGQNVHVAALATRLVRRGHDVTVFSRRDNATAPVQVTAPEGYVVEHVPAGPPTEVPKDELLQYMDEFARYLAARWTQERFDVAHSHFWMSGIAAVSAAATAKVPVAHTFHALGSVKRRYQGRRDTSPGDRIALETRLCQQVDHVVATCVDEVQELLELGMDRRRASVVPCGVDVELFTPTVPRERTADRPFRLLSVGRLVERKGTDDVVTALSRLPDTELVVAGGPAADALCLDPEVQRLQELARSLGVEDRVRFTGGLAREQMPEVFCSSDVVVAVPWYEPFGIVPLEAMACGRPVVGSAVGGMLDTIAPGVTGELVPPRDPERLAAVLGELLADPDRRAAYGAAGPERVRHGYLWDQVAEQTERVYAQVAARMGSEVAS
ncbi:MAG: glycosyltransferase [Actinomycetota bacterium]|nr:glycosyltransferase [Actinomycetota bacterium]